MLMVSSAQHMSKEPYIQSRKPKGRDRPSIEFQFVSTKMGQIFSVPIKPITRLVLNKTQDRQFERRVCRFNREKLTEFSTLSLSGSSNLWFSFQIFPQQS